MDAKLLFTMMTMLGLIVIGNSIAIIIVVIVVARHVM